MVKLYEWSIKKHCKGKYLAWGNCLGHHNLMDGTYIHTSPIMEMKLDNESLHLFTKSGTHYECKIKDILLDELECTKQSLMEMNMDVAFLNGAVELVEDRRKKKEDEVSGLLSDNELYLEFLGMTVQYAFFKKDGVLMQLDCGCHVGMFQDSYLIKQYGLVDVRYFDRLSGIEFYHFSDGLKAIQLRHIGGEFFSVGGLVNELQIKPNDDSIRVIPASEFNSEGLLSPDCVTGKSALSDFINRLAEEEMEDL